MEMATELPSSSRYRTAVSWRPVEKSLMSNIVSGDGTGTGGAAVAEGSAVGGASPSRAVAGMTALAPPLASLESLGRETAPAAKRVIGTARRRSQASPPAQLCVGSWVPTCREALYSPQPRFQKFGTVGRFGYPAKEGQVADCVNGWCAEEEARWRPVAIIAPNFRRS